MRRRRNPGRAEGMIDDLRRLPITLCAATENRIFAPAVKAEHPLSYADAFAVALTQELDAILVTGDPEFHAVEHLIQIKWLPEK